MSTNFDCDVFLNDGLFQVITLNLPSFWSDHMSEPEVIYDTEITLKDLKKYELKMLSTTKSVIFRMKNILMNNPYKNSFHIILIRYPIWLPLAEYCLIDCNVMQFEQKFKNWFMYWWSVTPVDHHIVARSYGGRVGILLSSLTQPLFFLPVPR